MPLKTFTHSLHQRFFSSFSPTTIALFLVGLFVFLTGNFTLFEKVLSYYPMNWENLPFLLALFTFFGLSTILLVQVLSFVKIEKWMAIIFILIAAATAYYTDSFGVIIDDIMIQNMVYTDSREVAGLMSAEFIIRMIFLGLLPAYIVFRYFPQPTGSVKQELKSRMRMIGVLLLGMVVTAFISPTKFEYFVRENRLVRFYANPTYVIYSLIKYTGQNISAEKAIIPLPSITDDVKLPSAKHNLYILVVGETARADRFSLNGYQKRTNPLLEQENVMSFTDVKSCATSTSQSLPCMFSILNQTEYKKDKALALENALDILQKQNVKVLWRDNNSDSKGVALRVKYEDFRTPTLNPACDDECRDIGMLSGLDTFIDANHQQDILIVLHQVGNHGPEYYRRYPSKFRQFQPICLDGHLSNCNQQEIDNGYDNAILYTDYFLANTIELLKKYEQRFNTGMLYVSDHGESLGENGIYLHAAPYASAPKEQTHVPAILWFGKQSQYDINQFEPFKHSRLSHDALFCSLLTAYNVKTSACTFDINAPALSP